MFNWLFGKKKTPKYTETVLKGTVLSKSSVARRPCSYNMALKPIYDRNFEENPSRYTTYTLNIQGKLMQVSESIFDDVKEGDVVQLTKTEVDMENMGLLESINNLHDVSYELVFLK